MITVEIVACAIAHGVGGRCLQAAGCVRASSTGNGGDRVKEATSVAMMRRCTVQV